GVRELFPSGKEQRGEPGFGVESQRGGDQRGPPRVRPHRLAGAEDLAVVEVGDPVERLLDTRTLLLIEPGGEHVDGGRGVALGDGMSDGNHGRDYPTLGNAPRAPSVTPAAPGAALRIVRPSRPVRSSVAFVSGPARS